MIISNLVEQIKSYVMFEDDVEKEISLKQNVIEQTEKFLCMLSDDLSIPKICVTSDGIVTMEWDNNPRIVMGFYITPNNTVTVNIDGTDKLYYHLQIGIEAVCRYAEYSGQGDISKEWAETITRLIKEITQEETRKC